MHEYNAFLNDNINLLKHNGLMKPKVSLFRLFLLTSWIVMALSVSIIAHFYCSMYLFNSNMGRKGLFHTTYPLNRLLSGFRKIDNKSLHFTYSSLSMSLVNIPDLKQTETVRP